VKKRTVQKVKFNQEFIFELTRKQRLILYVLIALVSFGLSFYYLIFALSQNSTYGFPLDDPWIHLTFAKNFVEYLSFSYFKNEIVTSGSTSPIYTFLLSVGFIVSNNEMILSYIFGIVFLILSVLMFYQLSSFEFAKENVFAIIITAIFISDKWMNFISVSGMETTMYIFILIACVYLYKKRKAIPFALLLGLILWGRPDGVVFIGALILDYLLVIQFSKNDKALNLFSKNDLIKIGIISGSVIVLYFTFNMVLSGSLLPNTYNAKLMYYSPEFRSRGDFFKYEVWEYFTRSAYGIIMVGFIFSVLKMILDLKKKKYNQNFLYIVFAFALVFIYWYKLPYAHRFGRYLMPIIPFFILVSGLGFRDLSKLLGNYFKSRSLSINLNLLVLIIILIFSVQNYNENKTNYAEQCKYITDRQVAAALWIKNNTKEGDIIATHDIGAIGYYSNRKMIDVAGLITPELIDKIHEKDYSAYLTELFKKNNVKYLVFMREWNRVVNQNPLFSSAENFNHEVEIMEIFKFIPDETLILPRDARGFVMYAQDLLTQKAPQQALQILTRSLEVEPRSSLTYFLMAYAYSLMNDAENYEKNLLKALEIFPDYKDALFQLGYFYKSKNRISESRKYLEKYIELFPNDQKVISLINSLPDSVSTNNNIR
ncbi:tetratricopeptide repeat protein, partial [Bacteroidota bacterium]